MKLFDSRVDLRHYDKSVLAYEEQPVQKGLVVFYGASSFTRWKEKYGNTNLEDDLRKADGSPGAINRGFGGSTAEAQLYYYDRLVKPLAPCAIVLKTGGNDDSAGYSPMESIYLQSRILAYARADFPGIKFFLNAMHPNKISVSRDDGQEFRDEYNELLREYCEKHDDTTYTSYTDSPLFYDDPKDVGRIDVVREGIFAEDNRHFNREGFLLCAEYWRGVLAEFLK